MEDAQNGEQEIPKNEIKEEKLDSDEKQEEKKVEEEKVEEKKEEDKKVEEEKVEEEKVEDKKEEDKKVEEEKIEDKKDKKKKKKEKKEKKEKPKKKEESKKPDKTNIIYSIDEQNKLCVDCGSENPTKVSINNGVLICESCSKEHELLGSSVSFLKNINDDYDEFLISFIVMGSNTKFKRFLSKENVDTSLPIKIKYKTAAVFYYRQNLKAKVEGKDEIKKEFKDPNELIKDMDDNYPEFNKKYVVKNQVLRKGSVINQNKFSFKYIFNKVFNRTKKKRGKSFDKKKKNDINEIDMNKTMPPELQEDKKEDNILESTRPFQEDKKDIKKKKEPENIDIKPDDYKFENGQNEDLIQEAKTEIKDKED